MSWIDDARAAAGDPTVAGVVGSLLSLKWAPGEDWKTKFVSFLCGLAWAVFGAKAIISAMGVTWDNAQTLFAFLLGLLGMNLTAKISEFVKTTSVADIIATIRNGGAKP